MPDMSRNVAHVRSRYDWISLQVIKILKRCVASCANGARMPKIGALPEPEQAKAGTGLSLTAGIHANGINAPTLPITEQ